MAPSKPNLRPLKTPKNMAFPSELYYNSPQTAGSDTIKKEKSSRPSLSPPSSYTDFLKALTPVFSPTSANGPSFPRYSPPASSSSSKDSHPSPISISYSPTSATFPITRVTSSKKKGRPNSVQPPSPPASAPLSSRTPHYAGRMRLPPPYMAYSPAVSSPRSSTVVRSPYPSPEWRIQYLESPRTSSSTSVSVQHVVTTTVTFKRSPPLGPPPKGKKRRVREEGEQ